MGFLRTHRLGKRYSSPLSWAISILLEMPAMLVAVLFEKTGALLRWIGGLFVRHVYYVFVRLARWVDGKPGWRQADMMIGVTPPTLDADGVVESGAPFDFEKFFAESRKRGEALLEAPLTIEGAKMLTAEERSDVLNAIGAMGGRNCATCTVSVVPSDPGKV